MSVYIHILYFFQLNTEYRNARFYDSFISNILMNFHTVFHRGYADVHPNKKSLPFLEILWRNSAVCLPCRHVVMTSNLPSEFRQFCSLSLGALLSTISGISGNLQCSATCYAQAPPAKVYHHWQILQLKRCASITISKCGSSNHICEHYSVPC